uniref:Protein kinase domain-containing protein n=1 Tax=Chromera velia CCMP2878 TaxID=1169474 RepID=A0A0G4FY81_9ALVE|eukprot:Cvel_3908.t1-p1 / transcript=Cvel_3908.t1 / gene=Cvel_3908 / organism=Chromera_velia_CCMP2878 / gene_product=Aurora kinase C, putative / transcript_product=Aurora kinase C, putative / location=Cvel_scaffold165:80752-89783(+) / protein_length=1528 / sequence_SO=supercontig / SO=protein_coding / is_pseudo=false
MKAGSKWAPEEQANLLEKWRESDGDFNKIHQALPHRTIGALRSKFSAVTKPHLEGVMKWIEEAEENNETESLGTDNLQHLAKHAAVLMALMGVSAEEAIKQRLTRVADSDEDDENEEEGDGPEQQEEHPNVEEEAKAEIPTETQDQKKEKDAPPSPLPNPSPKSASPLKPACSPHASPAPVCPSPVEGGAAQEEQAVPASPICPPSPMGSASPVARGTSVRAAADLSEFPCSPGAASYEEESERDVAENDQEEQPVGSPVPPSPLLMQSPHVPKQSAIVSSAVAATPEVQQKQMSVAPNSAAVTPSGGRRRKSVLEVLMSVRKSANPDRRSSAAHFTYDSDEEDEDEEEKEEEDEEEEGSAGEEFTNEKEVAVVEEQAEKERENDTEEEKSEVVRGQKEEQEEKQKEEAPEAALASPPAAPVCEERTETVETEDPEQEKEEEKGEEKDKQEDDVKSVVIASPQIASPPSRRPSRRVHTHEQEEQQTPQPDRFSTAAFTELQPERDGTHSTGILAMAAQAVNPCPGVENREQKEESLPQTSTPKRQCPAHVPPVTPAFGRGFPTPPPPKGESTDWALTESDDPFCLRPFQIKKENVTANPEPDVPEIVAARVIPTTTQQPLLPRGILKNTAPLQTLPMSPSKKKTVGFPAGKIPPKEGDEEEEEDSEKENAAGNARVVRFILSTPQKQKKPQNTATTDDDEAEQSRKKKTPCAKKTPLPRGDSRVRSIPPSESECASPETPKPLTGRQIGMGPGGRVPPLHITQSGMPTLGGRRASPLGAFTPSSSVENSSSNPPSNERSIKQTNKSTRPSEERTCRDSLQEAAGRSSSGSLHLDEILQAEGSPLAPTPAKTKGATRHQPRNTASLMKEWKRQPAAAFHPAGTPMPVQQNKGNLHQTQPQQQKKPAYVFDESRRIPEGRSRPPSSAGYVEKAIKTGTPKPKVKKDEGTPQPFKPASAVAQVGAAEKEGAADTPLRVMNSREVFVRDMERLSETLPVAPGSSVASVRKQRRSSVAEEEEEEDKAVPLFGTDDDEEEEEVESTIGAPFFSIQPSEKSGSKEENEEEEEDEEFLPSGDEEDEEDEEEEEKEGAEEDNETEYEAFATPKRWTVGGELPVRREVTEEDEDDEENRPLTVPPSNRAGRKDKEDEGPTPGRELCNTTLETPMGTMRIEKRLGRGGCGAVWLARDGEEKGYAIKMVDKEILANECDEEEFMREIEIHEALEHPNVIHLYAAFEDDRYIFLLLELAECSLWDELNAESVFNEKETAHVLRDIILAVNHCHVNEIIHRDIKPTNVLRGLDGKLKLSDFGLSSFVDSSVPRTTFCGTLSYMAPEFFTAKPCQYGPKVDSWALAVMAIELMSLEHPFEDEASKKVEEKILANDYKRVLPDSVSFECEHFLQKALQKDPADRISPSEMLKHPWIRMHTEQGYRSDLREYVRTSVAARRMSEMMRQETPPVVKQESPQLPAVKMEEFSAMRPERPRPSAAGGEEWNDEWLPCEAPSPFPGPQLKREEERRTSEGEKTPEIQRS